MELQNGKSEDDWCYFFQKAELARQQMNWNQVAEIGDSAFVKSEKPKHSSELSVFIEGYAHVGDFEKAEALTRSALKMDESVKLMLCSTWDRIEESLESNKQVSENIEGVKNYLGCKLDS